MSQGWVRRLRAACCTGPCPGPGGRRALALRRAARAAARPPSVGQVRPRLPGAARLAGPHPGPAPRGVQPRSAAPTPPSLAPPSAQGAKRRGGPRPAPAETALRRAAHAPRGPEGRGKARFLLEPGPEANGSAKGRGHRRLSYGRSGAGPSLPGEPMGLRGAGPARRGGPIAERSARGRGPRGRACRAAAHARRAACRRPRWLGSGESRPRARGPVRGPASGGER